MSAALEGKSYASGVGVGVGGWDDGEDVVAFADETFDGIEIGDFCFFSTGSCCSTVASVSFRKQVESSFCLPTEWRFRRESMHHLYGN